MNFKVPLGTTFNEASASVWNCFSYKSNIQCSLGDMKKRYRGIVETLFDHYLLVYIIELKVYFLVFLLNS